MYWSTSSFSFPKKRANLPCGHPIRWYPRLGNRSSNPDLAVEIRLITAKSIIWAILWAYEEMGTKIILSEKISADALLVTLEINSSPRKVLNYPDDNDGIISEKSAIASEIQESSSQPASGCYSSRVPSWFPLPPWQRKCPDQILQSFSFRREHSFTYPLPYSTKWTSAATVTVSEGIAVRNETPRIFGFTLAPVHEISSSM